jgi:hypothetical protein
MKTSNKILLTLILLGFGIFTAVHLTLYAKYKNDDITTERMLLNKWFTKYNLQTPTYLSVKSFENIIIIPSDSFYFELQKQPNGKAGYKVIHDSLFTGPDQVQLKSNDGRIITALNAPVKPLGTQQLNLYCPTISKINIEDANIFFRGSTDPARVDFNIKISNCSFNFSNRITYDTSYSNRFYDDITIHAKKSYIELNKKVVIKNLTVSLDDASQLQDNKSMIENIYLNCGDKSAVHLSGENLKKVKPIVQ